MNDSTTTLIQTAPQTSFTAAVLFGVSWGIARLTDLVAAWATRLARRRIALRIDNRTLRDIGMSRGELVLEAAKPFWRP